MPDPRSASREEALLSGDDSFSFLMIMAKFIGVEKACLGGTAKPLSGAPRSQFRACAAGLPMLNQAQF
jgi:hypothetical protein